MPWAAVANIGSSLLGSIGSNDAAEKAQQATDAAVKRNDSTLAGIQDAYNPYQVAGTGALSKLVGFGDYSPTPTAESVMGQPGYQFGLNQGLNGVQQGAAARGGLYSGAAGKALTRYGNDYATTKYGDAWNQAQNDFTNRWSRLSSLVGTGLNATNQSSQAASHASDMFGKYLTGNAAAQGANDIQQGNIWGNALNYLGSNAGSIFGGKKGPGLVDSTQIPMQPGGGYADGGPVRVEPVVGTRSPLPTGGGGGLSRDAILAILKATPAQPAPSGIAALPANPVTNPQAILDARMRSAGAYANGGAVNCLMGGPINGPGTSTSDSIPARLSNGEHVLRASLVTKLGHGSNARGQKALMALTELIDGTR